MKLTPLSDRLFLSTWSELSPFETNVLVYHGLAINLIVDTFLGPTKMDSLVKSLPRPTSCAPYTIVNTHYHFDHTWGNSAFQNSRRIATPLCYQWMREHFEAEREENAQHWEPGNQLCLPNCLIHSRILFPEESIEIFSSPGHTEDSCSVLFQKEGVLAVGDNLERPIPFLENRHWILYLETLQRYSECQAETIIAGHGSVDRTDMETTKQYILAWQKNQTSCYEKEPYSLHHQQNNTVLG